MIAVGRTSSQAEDEFRRVKQFVESGGISESSPEDALFIRKNYAGIADLAYRDMDKGLFDAMVGSAIARTGSWLTRAAVEPLIDQVLSRPDITACVFASDEMALMGLSCLREKRVAVPGRLSVAAFDNDPIKAPGQRLTSFDFNASGFIHRMLNFIARPPRFKRGHVHKTIEVEGIVMQRDTTGPAKVNTVP
jgi:DNA-binding LacI/PurR family transcriptional regulator